ncbi:MAG: hypothetical protein FRX49_11425, partial [Trebouxia sp. A1-2]
MAPRMGRGVLSSLVVIGLCFGQAQCRRLTAEEQQNAFLTQGSSSSKTYSPPPPPPADCFCSMYCNYCDSSHREQFSMTEYSCNSTYDSSNLQRCTDDLYTEDDVERSYETYMDYWHGESEDCQWGIMLYSIEVSNFHQLPKALHMPGLLSPPPPSCQVTHPPPSSPSPPPKSSPPPHHSTSITSPLSHHPHPHSLPLPKSSPPPPHPPPKFITPTPSPPLPKVITPTPSPPPSITPAPTSSPLPSQLAQVHPSSLHQVTSATPHQGPHPHLHPAQTNCHLQAILLPNYCDEPHRTTFDLTDHTCNSTYDSANLARCEDDLYHADSVNWNYEGYMDYWCDLLYDSSSGGVKSVSDVSCSDEWKAKIPTSCPRHYKCQDYCEDYKCPASPPPPPKSASPPPPTTKS